MYICRNCGQRFAQHTNFCNTCGSSAVEPENAPTPSYSYYSPAPTSSKAGLGQAIVSMIMGIEGICGAIVALLYAFITMGVGATFYEHFSYDYYSYEYTYGFGFFLGFTIVLAIIELIIGIVAVILSSAARNRGSKSGMAGAGKALGIVTIILSVVSFFIALMAAGLYA